MELEITPDKNPYAQTAKGQIAFKVLFDDQPLNNALVLAWHSVNGKTTHESARSGKDGKVTCVANPPLIKKNYPLVFKQVLVDKLTSKT